MRIISIEQPSAPINDGLEDIKMRGLNRIVILAGANGSGKSRLLRRIINGGNPGNQGNFWGEGYEFDSPQPLSPINFVSKSLGFSDPAGMPKDSIIQAAQGATTPGIDYIAPNICLCATYSSSL